MNSRQPRGLDSVNLSESAIVRVGLVDMLTAAIGDHEYTLGHTDVSVALLVIEAAKRAPDNAQWFPRGKWATIQSLQDRVVDELQWMFKPGDF